MLRVVQIADIGGSRLMTKYIPSPRDWVREQVELYESSGGTKGTTLRDTGLPVVIIAPNWYARKAETGNVVPAHVSLRHKADVPRCPSFLRS
jgi:hypothetical protein